MQRIGIAVVEHDGCYLVGIRPPHVRMGGFAEFPGGKCEPDESPDACAVRECREETGLIVRALRPLATAAHAYADLTIELHFWLCEPTLDVSDWRPEGTYRWVPRSELASLQFPPANASLVQSLIAPAL